MRKILLVFLFFLVSPLAVRASSEFHTKYVVDYFFDTAGNSTVKQQISLTNLQTAIYASSYQFTLPGPAPAQITGSDAQGSLNITTQPKGDGTQVTVSFNGAVVGKGNTQQFEVSFTGPKARHNGQIWEIILPGITDSAFIDEYQLRLHTDPALGKLAFISPSPVEGAENYYVFSKSQLTKIGVVAAFGNFQTFGFNLKYQLENLQDTPISTEIAIPADTNYQRVFYDSLAPSPTDVWVDEDGNWLAKYNLAPKEKLEVVAIGQAHLLAEPVKLFSDQVRKPELNKYLVSTQYWPSSDPEILQLAKKLKTPKAIYDYVTTTLTYDFGNVNGVRLRKGGKLALKDPSKSVCLEFTDLFVTLARAAGIPAREVDGYAYALDASSHPLSLSSDILHAWPQYWDYEAQMWINVDPTWGSTTGGVDYFQKLDFNHFAFVTHGISDTQPLAAGFYKTDKNVKNVSVNFATYKEYPPKAIKIDWEQPWQILPFKDSYSILNVTNTQGQARYHTDLDLTTHNFTLNSDAHSQIVIMPPFGKVQLPIVIKKGQYFNFSPQSFDVRVGNQDMTYNIKSLLYLAWHISVGLISSLTIVGLAIITGSAGSVYFQRPKTRDHLRGQGQGPKA